MIPCILATILCLVLICGVGTVLYWSEVKELFYRARESTLRGRLRRIKLDSVITQGNVTELKERLIALETHLGLKFEKEVVATHTKRRYKKWKN